MKFYADAWSNEDPRANGKINSLIIVWLYDDQVATCMSVDSKKETVCFREPVHNYQDLKADDCWPDHWLWTLIPS